MPSSAGIALEHTGAVLVAWDAEQEARLDAVVAKAQANGYEHAGRITLEELSRREPHLGGGATGAVTIPDESIICPWSTSVAFATEAVGAGVELRLGVEVTDADARRRRLGAAHDETATSGPAWVVNAAGLGSDLVNRRFGHDEFTHHAPPGPADRLRQAGPPAAVVDPAAGAHRADEGCAGGARPSTATCCSGPRPRTSPIGTTRRPPPRASAACSQAGRRILPELVHEEVTAVYAGLRAATEHRDYQIAVHERERYACVGGIRSTGLTASLAIAEHVVAQMGDAGLALAEAEQEPVVPRLPELGERGTRAFEDAGLIEGDPAYGSIVCFCERVTEGEVRDALGSPVPAVDLGGVRRRTRATNGRCQGFFCGAAVAARLASAVRP